MQIKKLRIQNIASLADAEIDFCTEPLSGAPIFLICGDTGAGKSTILDAICLALYDKTPRMVSVKKEVIDINADKRNKLYYDDNAQLLRRGTGYGEVELIFAGNDGMDYAVRWSVQRNHMNPNGRLQRESRREIKSLDGSYYENHKEPIEKKIWELVGMDYSQFCRTVMLAQGEFTKFLKCEGTEKAEILEKLTGTGIYSVIGRKISDKYSAIREEWNALEMKIRNVVLMTVEEHEAANARIGECNVSLTETAKQRRQQDEKLQWIREARKLQQDKEKTASELEKVTSEIASEEFDAGKRLVEDFRKTEKVRLRSDELSKVVSLIGKKELLLPAAKKSYNDSVAATAEAEKIYGEQQKVVDAQIKQYEAYEVGKLNATINSLNGRSQKLNNVLSLGKTYGVQTEASSAVVKEIGDAESRLDASKKEAEKLSQPLEEAGKMVGECEQRLSKLSISVNDMVKGIRRDLQEGDVCPVCGSKVVAKLEESYFESALAPFREEKREAEKVFNELQAKKMAEEKVQKGITSELKKLRNKQEKAAADVKKTQDELLALLSQLGYGVKVYDVSLEEEIKTELSGIAEKIDDARKRQEEAEKLHSQLKKSQGEERRLKKQVDACKEERENYGKSLTALESDLKNNMERKGVLESEVESFYAENSDVSEERIAELNAHKNTEIKDLETYISKKESEKTSKQGALDQLMSQIKECEEKKPELAEEETEVALGEQIKGFDESAQVLNQEVGQLRQRLNTDEEERRKVSKILEAMEKMRDTKDRWESLNRLLGDRDGSKFRNVAQSFILKSLLDNANRYMRCFTDRYTLTCNPGSLTILVSDSFKPGDAQPSSILSGGESFMASLSLALGLSGLRGGGMGVDIIFIDEGFGSLSSECLGNVMDTLEKLHQIGGRRVGLISHVAEMKERIPVQIHVQRESPALSKVSVTC